MHQLEMHTAIQKKNELNAVQSQIDPGNRKMFLQFIDVKHFTTHES
jgi:hypothetical protein